MQAGYIVEQRKADRENDDIRDAGTVFLLDTDSLKDRNQVGRNGGYRR